MRTLLAHAALAALAAGGCARSPKDSAGSAGAPRELEASGPAPADGRFSGTIAGHRFTITVEGGRVTRSAPEAWRWEVGAGEVSIQELGAADADTHFLVERSPRTIVRGDQELSVLTDVVLVAGDRVFRCTHEEHVDDPDSPAGKAAATRGVAACASLRVEP
jgi:hypothetical protein